jgi:uncharacterized protein (DUF433 family)
MAVVAQGVSHPGNDGQRSLVTPKYNATMLDWSTCPAVERDPVKVSGAWLFRGTRIPVSALFENLEGGATVEQFLAWFPGVAREQVDSVLEHAARSTQAA